MRGRARIAGLVLVTALLVAACAAGPNDAAASTPDPAGFWLGLWHGIICPIAFIVSLFDDSVGIYEVHNNGNWYNFGFVFGIALMSSIFSRPVFTAPARRRRRKS
ncbi:hypothetical protein [Amycolatopsis sp. ATCC 39116]|uniref:hypothetical protein n=1 Tax=Amycolatopsis TaxID=1813 RepID=UPI00026255E3|nr:hypothetical protein [Amycolatopsis sp. ATCC 39116]